MALDYINTINNKDHLVNQEIDKEISKIFEWAFGFDLEGDEEIENMFNHYNVEKRFIKTHPELPPLPPFSGDNEADCTRILFHVIKWYFKTEGKNEL